MPATDLASLLTNYHREAYVPRSYVLKDILNEVDLVDCGPGIIHQLVERRCDYCGRLQPVAGAASCAGCGAPR
jgi:hypothetical protein